MKSHEPPVPNGPDKPIDNASNLVIEKTEFKFMKSNEK
jgi:hypothetical protein